MRSDLVRRIRRLEARTAQHRWPVKLVFLCGKIDAEQRAALGPGERVARDWCACGNMLWARDRITTDPDDAGQRCGNRDEWPDDEGQPPRSGESDGSVDQQVCWLKAKMAEQKTSIFSPEATVPGTSPA
jgi:hypothetical protein